MFFGTGTGVLKLSAKKLSFSAIFVCFAAALSALETMLPPIAPIPGVRVGLGNIVTMFLLYLCGSWRAWDALAVIILRCLLAALIVGSPMSAVYGLAGGAASWIAMLICRNLLPRDSGTKRFDERYLPFTAVSGAVFHIGGQMACAVLIYGTKNVLAYTPILLASAIVGGLFTGFLTMLILKKFPEKLLSNIRNVM